jgi:protein TonB
MEANKILNADLLDIIFDGKNKSYGAYDLRKTYASRLKKAILATFIALAVILVGSVLANKVGSKGDKDFDVVDTQMAEIKKEEPVAVVPPPPPVKPPPPPEINQVKFTPPKVVDDKEVVEKVEEIHEDAAISTKTVESDNKVQVVQAPVEDKGTQVAEAPKDDDEGKVFNKVEIEAEYPGGPAAWSKYLKNNLDANTPVDNGAAEGTYTVIVRFIVSKDGSISDVVAETKHGYGMEAEAMKIIKKGPRWTPAQQNGRMVNAYRRQPITFVVQEN